MPLPLIAQVVHDGISSVPFAMPILKTIPWIAAIVLLKIYFEGARTKAERLMHSKVVMVTVWSPQIYLFTFPIPSLTYIYRAGHPG